ncbi:MAG: hypothetical protein HKN11_14080 [Rhizobiales bacterium]|nr:hypothetical protein [Hyphomicrobiales bacterium]
MHDFGWKCSPVERAGTIAPPHRDAIAQSAARLKPAAKLTSPKPAARAAKPAPTDKPSRPQKLSAARGGKADKLQQISGIGPKLEKTLNGLGFFHFDQIAGWSKDEVSWVDENLRFKGRIDREEWIAQAKLLAAGDMDAFAKKYGAGASKSKSGKSK